MDDAHRRPDGTDDATVEAVGTLSEAMEYVDRVKGRLLDLHQLMGRADILFGEAADQLRHAGHTEMADLVDRELVGRNLLPGMWTFQIVEAFGETFYGPASEVEREVRETLMAGRRHVYEAELKDARRRTRSSDPGA